MRARANNVLRAETDEADMIKLLSYTVSYVNEENNLVWHKSSLGLQDVMENLSGFVERISHSYMLVGNNKHVMRVKQLPLVCHWLIDGDPWGFCSDLVPTGGLVAFEETRFASGKRRTFFEEDRITLSWIRKCLHVLDIPDNVLTSESGGCSGNRVDARRGDQSWIIDRAANDPVASIVMLSLFHLGEDVRVSSWKEHWLSLDVQMVCIETTFGCV